MIDFDKAALDPQSGGLKPEFVPDSTTGGAGDKLHPNRTGYLAMGQAIDLDLFKPRGASRSAKSGNSGRTWLYPSGKYFILVSAAISSLPSAVVIVSRTSSPLPPSESPPKCDFRFRVGLHGVVEQYRIAAFQGHAQRRGRFDAEELKIRACMPRPRN